METSSMNSQQNKADYAEIREMYFKLFREVYKKIHQYQPER